MRTRLRSLPTRSEGMPRRMQALGVIKVVSAAVAPRQQRCLKIAQPLQAGYEQPGHPRLLLTSEHALLPARLPIAALAAEVGMVVGVVVQ
jgi:hypothetical protein